MEDLRRLMIRNIVSNGREKGWAEYAEQYGARDAKQANDWYRWFQKNGDLRRNIYVPSDVSALEPQVAEPIGPVDLKIKRAWEVQRKGGEIVTLHSYEKDKGEFDPAQFREDLLKDIKAISIEPRVVEFNSINLNADMLKGQLLEISLPDYHIGRDKSLEESGEVFKSTVYSIVNRALQITPLEKIVFVAGNDFLNSDSIIYGTTKGTPQFDYHTWYDSFSFAWRLLVEVIDELANTCPVDVVMVPGNHDHMKMTFMGEVLSGYYSKDTRVNVDSAYKAFKVYRYGANMFMYEHGELKASDYPLIMATNFPIMWSETKYREVHLGHIHIEKLYEFSGVKVRFMPSLAKSSDWEKSKGYSHLKQAQGLLWHKDKGLRNIIIENRD
jgi:hypothetical protein